MPDGDLFDWARQRDEAMASVAEHAEEHRPDFATDAAAFVLRFLGEHGASSGEVITNACKAAGIVPHDDRAFGPVYMGLSRRKAIVKVGVAIRTKGHGTAGGNVWALGAASSSGS